MTKHAAPPASGRPGSRGLLILGIVALVLLLGLWVRLVGLGCSEPTPAVPGGAAEDSSWERERWSALLQALEDEIEVRKELERRVEELSDALAVAGLLHEARSSSLSEASPPEPSADRDEEAMGADTSVAAGPRPGFDAAALVAAGLDPSRADALREHWEEHELEKLYLRDQAAREGWMISPRHGREQYALAARLRDEVGEEDYAALLYATGKPNAVEVTDVLARSPASDAGLEAGDQIFRYDSERVYRPNELRLATAAGEPNEFVSIEVMRDGRSVTLRVRRGPLGVLLQSTTRPPLP